VSFILSLSKDELRRMGARQSKKFKAPEFSALDCFVISLLAMTGLCSAFFRHSGASRNPVHHVHGE